MASGEKQRRVQALKVNQWLEDWDKVKFSPKDHRRKPEPSFYILSIPAIELKSLCGISRRQAAGVRPRAADLGIQRQHDAERSEEINRFVDFGYPWSTLNEAKRRSPEFNTLRKPGWLPTAIVVNILRKDDVREGGGVDPVDLISLKEKDGSYFLELPYTKWTNQWGPKKVPPLEVIDGQHRLWAFLNDSTATNFEVPVVAFNGLDISWQAYLFWTINIKPKRINASLAFDLYPLLRAEDWLDKAEGHPIYRESRSQELAETLWSVPESPWYDRINMLGERANSWPTQAAWIKSLMASFIRPWNGKQGSTGGLFGSRNKEFDGAEVLNWSRPQQAAFLIFAWQALKDSIDVSNAEWIKKQRARAEPPVPAATKNSVVSFYGDHSLIATDQGVRGYLQIINDMCFISASRLKLNTWTFPHSETLISEKVVLSALKTLERHPVANYIRLIAKSLATFDWRSSSDPSLQPDEKRLRLVFRGSSGYKELRLQLLETLSVSGDADIAKIAKSLLKAN